MLKEDFDFDLADEKSTFLNYSLLQMPRYYYQVVTAVELSDDIFGCLPEFAIMIMKHCLLFIPDCWFWSSIAIWCCVFTTQYPVSAVCQFLIKKKKFKMINVWSILISYEISSLKLFPWHDLSQSSA